MLYIDNHAKYLAAQERLHYTKKDNSYGLWRNIKMASRGNGVNIWETRMEMEKYSSFFNLQSSICFTDFRNISRVVQYIHVKR